MHARAAELPSSTNDWNTFRSPLHAEEQVEVRRFRSSPRIQFALGTKRILSPLTQCWSRTCAERKAWVYDDSFGDGWWGSETIQSSFPWLAFIHPAWLFMSWQLSDLLTSNTSLLDEDDLQNILRRLPSWILQLFISKQSFISTNLG